MQQSGYQQDAEKQRLKDIESLVQYKDEFENKYKITPEDIPILHPILEDLVPNKTITEEYLSIYLRKLQKEKKQVISRRKLLNYYRDLYTDKTLPYNSSLHDILIGKKTRSQSGVLVITVFTSPYPNGQNFSCQWDCAYCPNEPDQPRSYLLKEPGVLRANQENFDVRKQMITRLNTLQSQGHTLDKLEILILGGTWESYPLSYREEFITTIFHTANTYFSQLIPQKLTLEDEQRINHTAQLKIIGITIETRPDTISPIMIRELRRFNVTRVQIGVQHTNDDILRKIERRAYTHHTKRAIRLLKTFGFKVDIHLMPNLPDATPEKDWEMFKDVLDNPDLQADQWKIYPCEIVPWTKIAEWNKEGLYQPYSDEKLFDLLIKVKSVVHPWIRLNRVIRDIPQEYVLAGFNNISLRDVLQKHMKKVGLKCWCIRCREVKRNQPKEMVKTIYKYESSGGTEYFISLTAKDKFELYGFCRLRLQPTTNMISTVFPSLPSKIAWIRELHVYGMINKVNTNTENSQVQHRGIGKKLLKEAENIALQNDFYTMGVIAGTGTTKYYEKNGFKQLDSKGGYYMIKEIKQTTPLEYFFIFLGLFTFLFSVFYYN